MEIGKEISSRIGRISNEFMHQIGGDVPYSTYKYDIRLFICLNLVDKIHVRVLDVLNISNLIGLLRNGIR